MYFKYEISLFPKDNKKKKDLTLAMGQKLSALLFISIIIRSDQIRQNFIKATT